MDEMGDVPRSALVIRLTPRELTNNPTKNTKYRFTFSKLVHLLYKLYNYLHVIILL